MRAYDKIKAGLEEALELVRHPEIGTGRPVGNEFPNDPDAPINNPHEQSNPFAPKR